MILLPALAIVGVSGAEAAEPIAGRWITDDGKAIVMIAPCGRLMCGHITTILAPTPKGPPVDERNPNAKLRRRPLRGIEVLSGFSDQGKDWRGHIYDPEAGRWYKSILSREPGGLKAQGCILFFCRAQHWVPAR
ncbi:MAG: DUF2147 domain-containing protein [Sphingomonadales bacterium]|nr:DUF2147 domain-containing protein [Sphingomonadales bacterium]